MIVQEHCEPTRQEVQVAACNRKAAKDEPWLVRPFFCEPFFFRTHPNSNLASAAATLESCERSKSVSTTNKYWNFGRTGRCSYLYLYINTYPYTATYIFMIGIPQTGGALGVRTFLLERRFISHREKLCAGTGLCCLSLPPVVSSDLQSPLNYASDQSIVGRAAATCANSQYF